jgi:hypothetical protein
MFNFFKNTQFISYPSNSSIIVSACDDLYFKRFGDTIISSCINSRNDIHVHVINPSIETINEFKKYKSTLVSISYETSDFTTYHPLLIKTYYYFSRYFISNFLFENYNITNVYITDIDMFFNNVIDLPKDKDVGIFYNSKKESLWRQTSAGFVYINKNKKYFLDNLISNYLNKLKSIDFLYVENNVTGLERANYVGLDQVCLSEEVQKILQDSKFLNLNELTNFISKEDDNRYTAWNLIRFKKDPNFDNYIRQKFKENL